jgi:hypothetical protein
MVLSLLAKATHQNSMYKNSTIRSRYGSLLIIEKVRREREGETLRKG